MTGDYNDPNLDDGGWPGGWTRRHARFAHAVLLRLGAEFLEKNKRYEAKMMCRDAGKMFSEYHFRIRLALVFGTREEADPFVAAVRSSAATSFARSSDRSSIQKTASDLEILRTCFLRPS